MLTAKNKTQNLILADQVKKATGLKARMKGLLCQNELPFGHGMWITPCNSIHTFFMKFSIDVLFLSSEGKCVQIYKNVRPFRITPMIRKAHSVLELPAGTLDQSPTQLGDLLVLETNA